MIFFMKTLVMIFTALTLMTSAHALEWQCDKSIELLAIPQADTPRPLLVVKVKERKDGTTVKLYKPLAATTEAVADFLTAITETTKVCLKAYDPLLPAPVPLLLLDIKLDQ